MEPITEKFLKQMDEILKKQTIISSVYEKMSYRVQKAVKKRQIDSNVSTLNIDVEFNRKAHCLLIIFNSRQELVFVTNDEDLTLLDDKFFTSELFPMSNSVSRIEKSENDIAYRYSFIL